MKLKIRSDRLLDRLRHQLVELPLRFLLIGAQVMPLAANHHPVFSALAVPPKLRRSGHCSLGTVGFPVSDFRLHS
jgi:hypothetical protein